MTFSALHPRLFEALVSAGILLGSFFAAWLLSRLFAKVLARLAARTTGTIDDRLVLAWRRPLAWLLFLVGAYGAAHRLPVDARALRYVDGVLYAAAVFLMAMAVTRGLVLLIEWYVAKSRAAGGHDLATEFAPLLGKIGRVFITLVAVTILLQHLGVNVASLVVSLGVGSLAVGLAAQDTLANMFAGFVLMLDRPFRVGDRVRLASGELGDVETIGMRATRIRTTDETLLVVPNSLLVKDRLVNLTQPTRSVTTRAEVSVGFGSDLAVVKPLLVEAALSSPLIDAERTPDVVVQRFGEASVDLQVVFWVRDYMDQGACRSQVLEAIYRRLLDADIARPLPARRIIHEGSQPEGPEA
jgi:small-conductance mechanosensitive channel